MLHRLVRLALGLLLATALQASTVVAVSIEGVVHPITAEIIEHAILQAQQQQAELLLIRLNTPGGFLEATRRIVEKIVASPVPVVTLSLIHISEPTRPY